jgi:hypothetical protein
MLSSQEALLRARSEMEAAGRALEAAMSWLEVAPKADKVAISAPLEQALERLRAARSDLFALEGLLNEPSLLAATTE